MKNLLDRLEKTHIAYTEHTCARPDQWLDIPAGPGWKGDEYNEKLRCEYVKARNAALDACIDGGMAAKIIAAYPPAGEAR